MNAEQRTVYDTIMNAISRLNGGFFFLDAPGGTGKTFLISLILATLGAEHKIALAIASTGIAATLLAGGRTAHSALKLPLNLQINEAPSCNISKSSGMGNILRTCEIIIYDECSMTHRDALEALHRTLKDFRGKNELFGGVLILLSGDFRQTLPVIPRSTPADELHACLKSSVLWPYVQKLSLKTNMRVQLMNDASVGRFAKQLLDIGNGKMPIDETTKCITFPVDFCEIIASKDQLITKVFPDIAHNYKNHHCLSVRAILAPKNQDVNTINYSILESIESDEKTYKSIDTATNTDEVVNYPTEFLNSLEFSGLSSHVLKLKVGVPITLLCNINPPRRCNGTRLAVKRMMDNIIEATVLNGRYKEEHVLLPRIPMIPTDLPFDFKRLQFPVRLAFAMTINKAQGQSLEVFGLDLERPCFSHGQLYVACSSVGNPKTYLFMRQAEKRGT
ncbi:ATP-dependent DNA helicase PIF7-like [Wyeomyia smithii]|uniref:ATP-dependent DNA helicase PIF7-like n=1 Tax=Wyeomyia smithii TaxID=174621 RepID=UPI00246809DE|nr:ATP-dependent DNA helicase PIF7-like [Wyeomyia smithii]